MQASIREATLRGSRQKIPVAMTRQAALGPRKVWQTPVKG